MYYHSVIFDLNSGLDEKSFFDEAKSVLPGIEGVKNFKISSQVSPKNDYAYCFSMEFDSKAAFEAYAASPVHCDFVARRWDTEVSRFLEIDLEEM